MDMISSNLQTKKISVLFIAIMLHLGFFSPELAFAQENINIAVIYPDVREPYLSIFKEIKSGIDTSLPKPAETIILDKETTPDNLETMLDDANIDSVITLGSSAYKYANQIAITRAVLGAAVFTRPTDDAVKISSISMIVSPEAQLLQLLEIAPQIKNIYVIYNPDNDEWLIELAKKSLMDSEIKLQAIASTGLKESASAYQELIENNKLGDTDALWILQGDKAISENSIFSRVLQQAWEKHFVVFSANPAHVKRGALFATYPNNIKLGEKLGKTIINARIGDNAHVVPLNDISVAFNSRTSEHLKLNINRSKLKSFDLVFPNR